MADGMNGALAVHARMVLEEGAGEESGTFAPTDLLLRQDGDGKIRRLDSTLPGYAAKPRPSLSLWRSTAPGWAHSRRRPSWSATSCTLQNLVSIFSFFASIRSESIDVEL